MEEFPLNSLLEIHVDVGVIILTTRTIGANRSLLP
jgi:hypothetical protein